MPLIKRVTAVQATQRAVVLDLGDLKREADRMLEQAHAEAAAIGSRAAAEAQELIDGAAAEGYDEGYARGLDEGRVEGTKTGHDAAHGERAAAIDELVAGWSDALSRWEGAFAAMLADAEHDALALALAISEKIVFRVIEQQPDLVTTQIRATLAHLCRPAAVTIAVNPDDRPLVESTLAELLRQTHGCEHARLEDDDAITRGGCIVRTEHGRIDATIEKQMERIVSALLPTAAVAPETADVPDRSPDESPDPSPETFPERPDAEDDP